MVFTLVYMWLNVCSMLRYTIFKVYVIWIAERKQQIPTCSPVFSSVSVWNVSSGCAWFSDNQTAFSCKFTSVYGKYCNWLPDTSSTCNSRQFPNSLGNFFSLLSRKLSTPSDAQLPISTGIDSKAFLSTFKLFNFVKRPIDFGNLLRKFSVKISSCRFSHLLNRKEWNDEEKEKEEKLCEIKANTQILNKFQYFNWIWVDFVTL